MKNKDYWGDPRYFKLWEKMEMLGIKDVSSPCQDKNGTVVWRLPIKNTYSRKGEFIEVASYEAGYVRVLNTCMSPYYINPIRIYYSSKKPKLIPIEIDRLEYLISYCLKNMYIKLANERLTLLASNENLECEVADLINGLGEMSDEIIQARKIVTDKGTVYHLTKELEREKAKVEDLIKDKHAQINHEVLLASAEEKIEHLNWLVEEMEEEIAELKQEIAVTEANTELFRGVHMNAYKKMIKIKEIIESNPKDD